MTRPQFHIPVWRSSFFEEETHEAIRDFLAAEHSLEDGAVIAAIRSDYLVHAEDYENVVASARLSLLARRPDGSLASRDGKDLSGAARDGYSRIAYAFSTDDLAAQSVAFGILPWSNRPLRDRFLGRYFTHVQARNFAIFGDEYPASRIDNDIETIAGTEGDVDARRFFLNLILPQIASHHEAIEEAAKYPDISNLVRAIYENLLDGHADQLPLAPIDYLAAEAVE